MSLFVWVFFWPLKFLWVLMSIYLISDCCWMSDFNGNCYWNTAYIYVCVCIRKHKMRKKNEFIWNSSVKAKGKQVCWDLCFPLGSDTFFQAAKGVNTSDICKGCASFITPRYNLSCWQRTTFHQGCALNISAWPKNCSEKQDALLQLDYE